MGEDAHLVLAAVVPAMVLNILLPPGMFIIGLAVGAACAGVAISALCGMSLQQSSIAAGIYLAVQTVISIGLDALSR
jgi:hypothetical protein